MKCMFCEGNLKNLREISRQVVYFRCVKCDKEQMCFASDYYVSRN